MKISNATRSVRVEERTVRLRRTTGGVVELWADDDPGLAAGLGFAHAHDRMVQMMLVRLIAQGMSLEEAARARGVSMNTARSHLKHAFAKTGTARQSELLRLVITGVGAIGDGRNHSGASQS